MSVGSVSGAAQSMPLSTAGGEALKSGGASDPEESARYARLKAKVRVAGGVVMLLLLLVTAAAVVLTRFDFGFDEAQAGEVEREVAPSPAVSRGAADAGNILDDAQRESPRDATAPSSGQVARLN